MADNVAYTPGTGATIAADDVGGALHQRVKLSLGADGSAADAPGDGTDGLLVNLGANNDVVVTEAQSAAATATWTSATADETTLSLAVTSHPAATIAVNFDGGDFSTTGWIRFEGSPDSGTSWVGLEVSSPDDAYAATGRVAVNGYLRLDTYDSQTRLLLFYADARGLTTIRARLDEVFTGTMNVGLALQGISSAPMTGLQPVILSDPAGAVMGNFVGAGEVPVAPYGTDGVSERRIKTDANGELQVDVLTLPALVAGTANIGDVDILTVPAPLSTAGNGTAATAHRVTIASDSTGVIGVTDNGGSLTIDAPVATPAFVRLSDGAAPITTLPVSIASVPSHAVTNAGTFAVQVTAVPEGQTWVVSSANTAHVAAARTTLLDLFNASGSGKILTVRGVYILPTLTAVSGIGLTYEIIRTSAVGTGGSSATPASYDSSNTPLPAQVTARVKPAGGATTSATLLYVNGSSEETIPYGSLASVLNHVAAATVPYVQGLVLREGQGLKVDQTTSSNVGSVNVVIVFTSA